MSNGLGLVQVARIFVAGSKAPLDCGKHHTELCLFMLFQ